MAAHQQVGSFRVVNQAGVLVKNGGNVASYFCTPDGRVIHAVTGPAGPDELLAAARWAVEVSSGGGAVVDPGRIAAAHREELEHPSQGVADAAKLEVHRLLASRPLPPLNEVYRTVFEDILGQRISPPDTERVQAERAFAAARRAKLPVLLILHGTRDNQAVLDRWNQLVAGPGPVVADRAREEGGGDAGPVGGRGRGSSGLAAERARRLALGASPSSPGNRHPARSRGGPSFPPATSPSDLATTGEARRSNPLTALSRSYVVVAMRLEELPALSRQLGIAPYAAPDRGSPMFVIARSDARQLSAVTTWERADELAYAMAQGIVQEAKEHRRTPEQLRELLAVVDPVDAELGDQLRSLMGGPDRPGPHRASRAGGPPGKS